VKKGLLLAIGALVLLAGCGSQGNKAGNAALPPTWKGAAYHLAFDTAPAKPNPAGLTIPAIKYTANPDALETRASLVVQFDPSVVKKNEMIVNQIILAPFDISGAEGTLPADLINSANQQMGALLGSYCVKGKVKVTVVLVRSSISPSADDAEIDAKRLSDRMPIELEYKNPHPKC
jgi:hypothetical protein